MAALEGIWLVLSGCVQVDAGKPLIIAASLGGNERNEPDFLHQDGTAKPVKKRQVKWHWHACRWPLQ